MNRSPEDYIHAIDRAVRQDNLHRAADLVFEAFECYPTSEKIRRYARVFASKTLEFRQLPPNPEMSLNLNWVLHNRIAYRGRWVALRRGELVSDAASLEELKKQLGEKIQFLFCTVVY